MGTSCLVSYKCLARLPLLISTLQGSRHIMADIPPEHHYLTAAGEHQHGPQLSDPIDLDPAEMSTNRSVNGLPSGLIALPLMERRQTPNRHFFSRPALSWRANQAFRETLSAYEGRTRRHSGGWNALYLNSAQPLGIAEPYP